MQPIYTHEVALTNTKGVVAFTSSEVQTIQPSFPIGKGLRLPLQTLDSSENCITI